MPLIVNIAEAATVRRLAASLAYAKSSRNIAQTNGWDFDQTVRVFLRHFPWSGVRSNSLGASDISSATVGQYFVAFDWDGTAAFAYSQLGAGAATGLLAQSEPAASVGMALLPSPEAEAAPAANDDDKRLGVAASGGSTKTLEGFFNDFF